MMVPSDCLGPRPGHLLLAGIAAAVMSLSSPAHAQQDADGLTPAPPSRAAPSRAAPSPAVPTSATSAGPRAAATPTSGEENVPYAPAWRRNSDDEQHGEVRDPGYVVAGFAVLGSGVALAIGSMVVLVADDTQPNDGAQMQLLIDGQVAQLAAAGEVATPGNVFLPPTARPTTAMAMMAVATGMGMLGVPLVLLGGASRRPQSPEGVAIGTTLATAGMAIGGIGATIAVAQASYVDVASVAGEAGNLTVAYDRDQGSAALPLVLGLGGAAAGVAGLVVWFGSAGEADAADEGGDAGDEDSAAGLRASGVTAQLRATPTSLSLSGSF